MLQFKSEGLSCGHCVATVTKAVKALDTQAVVTVDLPTQMIKVETQKSLEDIASVIEKAGYPVLEKKKL